jgi:hypothetical protein
MKRETVPCQHDNSITYTQPRKGLDNHSPSATRFAVPGESFGLTLLLRFSDRCRFPAMPSYATGSGIAGFRFAHGRTDEKKMYAVRQRTVPCLLEMPL